jgi:two-component system cell cycle sensor histidine kinase/response regulator CckA
MPPDTILVVDDEPVVLSSVCRALELAGYSVLRAASPQGALRVGLSHRGPIRLMVTDVLMPELSGPRLACEFASIHPEARFLFIAGLPDHPEVRESIVNQGLAFLPKPFMPRELLAKVTQVLGAPMAMRAGM